MKTVKFTLLALLSLALVACNKSNDQDADAADPNAVDLGLSVKWAKCNVGATNPEDYGDYYAWGEIETKEIYGNMAGSNYKWVDELSLLTKYNNGDDSWGVYDNLSTLEPEDDVAHIKLGAKWRMPSNKELQELIDTDKSSDYRWDWKTINGHTGWEVVYLKNNNSIFLPAAGYRDYDLLEGKDAGLWYWSANLGPRESSSPYDAFCLTYSKDGYSAPHVTIKPGEPLVQLSDRMRGYSIRPVTE